MAINYKFLDENHEHKKPLGYFQYPHSSKIWDAKRLKTEVNGKVLNLIYIYYCCYKLTLYFNVINRNAFL